MLFHQFWMAAMADGIKITQAYMDACYTAYRLTPMGMLTGLYAQQNRPYAHQDNSRTSQEEEPADADDLPKAIILPFKRQGP